MIPKILPHLARLMPSKILIVQRLSELLPQHALVFSLQQFQGRACHCTNRLQASYGNFSLLTAMPLSPCHNVAAYLQHVCFGRESNRKAAELPQPRSSMYTAVTEAPSGSTYGQRAPDPFSLLDPIEKQHRPDPMISKKVCLSLSELVSLPISACANHSTRQMSLLNKTHLGAVKNALGTAR